ncbi:unnamed protein product [Ectocarpus sp. CCAP 1310/34]|nr:unnamed protein product [Ectocarpus sp. CCAP 1310/34]
MVPSRNKQQSTTTGFDGFSQRSSCERSSTSTCGVGDVILEFCTPGARSPIHFVDATTAAAAAAASCRGRPCGGNTTYNACGSSRGVRPPTLLRQQSAPASSTARPSANASVYTGKHHRRTSTPPLDGARLTLLGVSNALNTPVLDNWEVARALLESNTDLRTRNDRGMTPLHLACSTGEVDAAKVLLLAGADSHARDHRSRCPLHMAALSGKSELVSSLLTCGADPNKASDLGTTALHNAALLGRVEASRALLVAGADPNAIDHNSFSPLYLASQNGHTQLVLDLLAAGADTSVKTVRGFTPLHVAARCGRLTALRALLDAGEAVDSPSTPAGTTPLHLAAGFSRLSCVEELLLRGADPSRKNKRGATPLDMVGTLVTPVSARPALATQGGPETMSGKAKLAREAFEKNLAEGERVRLALTSAQRWQRKWGMVLVCETLRRRSNAVLAPADGASDGGAVAGRERLERDDDDSKRRCRRSRAGEPVATAVPVHGWLVAQLCVHADPALMKGVIEFL